MSNYTPRLLDNYNKEIKSSLSKKLNNSEYQFDILEGEPTVFLEDGREVPKRLIDQYEKDLIIETLQYRLENDNHLTQEMTLKDNLEDLMSKLEGEE